MNHYVAVRYLRRFLPCERIREHYDNDPKFAEAVNALCPGFEYPDHYSRTIAEFLKRYQGNA